MKRAGTFVAGLLVGVAMVLTGTVYATSGERNIAVLYNDVKIRINGKLVPLTDEPFGYNGRTYVPLRFIAEALGQQVGWDQATKTVLIGGQPPPEPIGTAETVARSFMKACINDGDIAAVNRLVAPSARYHLPEGTILDFQEMCTGKETLTYFSIDSLRIDTISPTSATVYLTVSTKSLHFTFDALPLTIKLTKMNDTWRIDDVLMELPPA